MVVYCVRWFFNNKSVTPYCFWNWYSVFHNSQKQRIMDHSFKHQYRRSFLSEGIRPWKSDRSSIVKSHWRKESRLDPSMETHMSDMFNTQLSILSTVYCRLSTWKIHSTVLSPASNISAVQPFIHWFPMAK